MSSVRRLDKVIYSFLLIYAFFSSISIAGCNIAVSLAFLFAVIRYIIRPFKIKIEKSLASAIALFFSALIISSFFAYEPVKSFHRVWGYFYRMLPLFLAAAFVKTRRQLLVALILMSVSIAIADCYAIWQGIHGNLRARGFSSHAMILAGYLIQMLPLLAVAAVNYSPLSAGTRTFFAIAAVLSTAALIFNGTRGAWLAVASVVFIYGLLSLRRMRKRELVGLAAALIVICVLFAAVPQLQNRLGTLTDMRFSSNSERILLWRSAWRMFLDHPLTGVGPGNFPKLYQTRYILPEALERNHVHAHNNLLHMLAEAGILGLAGFVWMFVWVMILNYRRYANDKTNALALAVFLVTVALFVQGLTEFNFGNSAVIRMFWFILGLFCADGNIRSDEEETEWAQSSVYKEGCS